MVVIHCYMWADVMVVVGRPSGNMVVCVLNCTLHRHLAVTYTLKASDYYRTMIPDGSLYPQEAGVRVLAHKRHTSYIYTVYSTLYTSVKF